MRLYSNLSKRWSSRWAKTQWRIKQLLPLTYRSRYKDGADKMHFCVWRMWLGRCFSIEDVVVAEAA